MDDKTYLAALEVERDGYLADGRKERAAEVEAEIARVSGEPAKRGRTRKPATETAVAAPDVETADA